jgi:intracellular multiplication protein IcmO
MMQRGLDEQHEMAPTLLLRDTRTLGMKTRDFFKDPTNGAIMMFSFAMFSFFLTPVTDFVLVVGLFVFLYAYTRKQMLPFRIPLRAGVWDYNDIQPGSGKANKSRGICFFGNKKTTNEELWFANEDMRTHVLIFGSTGSGKTQALMSLAFNALVQGSGFLYVDGKGDNSVFASIFSMVRYMGREDDILLVSFMTGARDIVGAQEKRLSNTMNPFCTGSSSMLTEFVVSLMDSGGQSQDGDMWKGRAIVFVGALFKILVYMRDQGKILLDANSIRAYFDLTKLESISLDKVFPRDNQDPVPLADAPEVVLEPINNYLITLPGFDKTKKGKQSSTVFEQHGFITMQLTKVFGSLADTYGHIIRTNLAEVDLKDVVLNRRILIVLLPALEKSPDELSNLGKVVIASLRATMAAGLGEGVEGTYRDVIGRKITNAPTPYMCILDEYGYYAVKGFAVVPAQARSLGFSVVFAGQDLPAFQKASKEEAASIGANCNIKICMKLEDPTETWEFFHKTAGESYVTKVDSFQTNASSLLNNYMDARSASSEKRQRIDLLDLKEQTEGEAHIFFKSRIVRARMFYAAPKSASKMRLNHFLKVEAPASRLLIDMETRQEQFATVLKENAGELYELPHDEGDEIHLIAETMRQSPAANPIERSIAALLALQHQQEPKEDEIIEEELPDGKMNIFSKTILTDRVKNLVGNREIDNFSSPLLNKPVLKDKIGLLERVLGRSASQVNVITDEIMKDMLVATDYPPEVENLLRPNEEVIASAHELCDYLNTLKGSEETSST